eukprot:TRINITY_DN1321_c0_g1_i1.p1 TRINITY_DN1321_c0_g1~~TRINITY_DN1321_c0_g1_i1.p1  ORF type:complete len:132 (-),score=2.02 TRINITY_DN1321_c0_g1_i1:65-460(-)
MDQITWVHLLEVWKKRGGRARGWSISLSLGNPLLCFFPVAIKRGLKERVSAGQRNAVNETREGDKSFSLKFVPKVENDEGQERTNLRYLSTGRTGSQRYLSAERCLETLRLSISYIPTLGYKGQCMSWFRL